MSEKTEDQVWNEAVCLVTDWANHKGLRVSMETDDSMEPEFSSRFLNVTLDPKEDQHGITMARPTVATLVRRYIVSLGGARLEGYGPFIEVRLVRHGRASTVLVVSPEELQRFGMEARHLDRID